MVSRSTVTVCSLARLHFCRRAASAATVSRPSTPARRSEDGVLRRTTDRGQPGTGSQGRDGSRASSRPGDTPVQSRAASIRKLWEEAVDTIDWQTEPIRPEPARPKRPKRPEKLKSKRREPSEPPPPPKPMPPVETDPFAIRIAEIYREHQGRNSGLDQAETAIWNHLWKIEDPHKRNSSMSRVSEAGLVALIVYGSAAFDTKTRYLKAKANVRLAMAILDERGPITPKNMAAHVAFLKLLLRRARIDFKQAWELEATFMRRVIGYRSDPFGRTPHEYDPVDPFGSRKLREVRNRDEAYREAFDKWRALKEADAAEDLFSQMSEQDLHSLLDLMLEATGILGRNEVAVEVMNLRDRLGLVPANRTYMRLMQVARSTTGEGQAATMARRVWSGYKEALDLPTEEIKGVRGRAGAADQLQYEILLWSEFIGFLVAKGNVDLAADLLDDFCAGKGPAVSPEDMRVQMQNICAFRNQIVSKDVVAFLAAGQQRASSRAACCDPRLHAFILSRINVAFDAVDRLDDMRQLMMWAIENCPVDEEIQALVWYRASQTVECHLAVAFAPSVPAKASRDLVEQAMTVFTAAQIRFGMFNHSVYMHKVIDALAICGQYGRAVALVADFIQLQGQEAAAAGEVSEEAKVARRLHAQQLFESALGLLVKESRPALRNLLDACRVLFDMQPKDQLVLSEPLQATVRNLISSYESQELVELLQGEDGRTMYWISQAQKDEAAIPLLTDREIWTRAPGRNVPARDYLFSASIEGMLGYLTPKEFRSQWKFTIETGWTL